MSDHFAPARHFQDDMACLPLFGALSIATDRGHACDHHLVTVQADAPARLAALDERRKGAPDLQEGLLGPDSVSGAPHLVVWDDCYGNAKMPISPLEDVDVARYEDWTEVGGEGQAGC